MQGLSGNNVICFFPAATLGGNAIEPPKLCGSYVEGAQSFSLLPRLICFELWEHQYFNFPICNQESYRKTLPDQIMC